MGDAARSAIMNRSSIMGSARKDNAEEVARRRAAMQQEIEQRQKLARKLQDEKMARAAAQKEERLLKQREAQKREMLRAKIVLDRRAQVLAEKEKEKKEAVLAKAHAVASRLSAQHKSRPVYAFGSSTPRELGYLTQLTKEQKVYDRKLTPSDRSPTATSGSSGRLTSTPSNGSRNNTPGASMTRSLYVSRSDIKPRHKPILNNMTQSVMFSPKTVKSGTTPVHRRSPAQRPATATPILASRRSEIPKTAKKLAQHAPPLYGRKPQTAQPKPSRASEDVPKPKPVPRRVTKPAETKKDGEIKQAETKLEKAPREKLNSTFVILEKGDAKEQNDLASTEAQDNAGTTKEVAPNKAIEAENLVENGPVLSVSEKEVKTEAEKEEPRADANEVLDTSVEVEEKAASGDVANGVEENANVKDAPLLDLGSNKDDDSSAVVAEPNSAVKIANAEIVFDQEADKGKQQKVEEKRSEDEANALVAELEDKTDDMEKPQVDAAVPYPVHSEISEVAAVHEKQRKPKSATEVHPEIPEVAVVHGEQQESATEDVLLENTPAVNEELPNLNDETDNRQNNNVVVQPGEEGEVKEESSAPAVVAEANGNVTGTESDEASTIQSTSTPKIEDSKLAEEKRLLEERRRAQEERLEREQREREMRKAKLASIMSRTRGGAPPTAIVTPTQNVKTSEIVSQEPVKITDRVPSPVETAPMKNALSHTAASVLQKLATTNPKLLSVLQRNGSNPSLADELSAADPSMSMTLPGQPDEPIAAHEGSSTVRHLPFEPDVNHRPVAMK